MNKKLSLLSIIALSFVIVMFSATANAGCIVGFTTVFFDEADNEVGGISETYLTYDIAYYYDAGADGLLYYTSPTEVIDGDFGEGIDDIYFDLLCGTMYGIEVSYTTNNYQRNRVVCADTVHYVRSVFIPTPFAEQPFYDPYRLSQIEPKRKENGISLMIPENPSEFYSGGEVTIVGFSFACIRTPTVASVEFQTINSDVTTDNPATLGGGQRVFPDRQTPADGVNRRTVRVRAQLAGSGGSPAFTSGARVYFRNFDVDDPSDDPIIDPMGNLGNDNRGTPQSGTLNLPSATTDSSGIATVEFTTTMQPGDNFVIAASTDPNYLNGSGVVVNGTGLQDSAGNQLPTTRGKRTDMLSVWRRLHIEVDSMGQAQDNVAVGNTQTGGTLRRSAYVVIPVNVTDDLEVNRFENGRMVFVGGNPFHRIQIVSNTARSVTVRNVSNYATISYIATNQFQLYDDDDFNGDDGPSPAGDNTLDGDTGEDIPAPDDIPARADITTNGTALLQTNDTFCDPPIAAAGCNVFANAYVRPVYDIVDPRDDSFFQANVSPPGGTAEVRSLFQDWDSSGTNTADEFWSVYLMGAYQDVLNEDNDPQTERLSYGIVDGITGLINPSTGVVDEGSGALIFTEVHRIGEIPGYTAEPANLDSMAVTVAHEVTHLLGCRHGDGAVQGTNPNSGAPVSNRLSSGMIFRIRGLMHP